MKLLMPIGVVLVVIGLAGSATSCFDGAESQTNASQLRGQTDSAADQANESSSRMLLAPLAGLTLAVGLVCLGIGMGNWRRPVPSDVRPANPWSDQPGEHGDPPKGLV